jgi:3-keto-disaccharide hydrolase
MSTLTRRDLIAFLLAAPATVRAFCGDPSGDSADWIALFDGKSLEGWKANQHADTFKVVDGQIVVHGERTHLFYVGPVQNADFKNFELSAEVLTRPGANSGIYFHTAYQPSGWPAAGFEVQVSNTHEGRNGYTERKKTGSLYAVRNVYKQLVNDNEWFRMNILVRGKQVQIRVNDMLVVDYVEPDQPFRADLNFQRVINHGTFALQGHDPGSTTYFKNIRARPLPDNIAQISNERPEVDELYRDIIRLGAENYPLVDYHVHLKGGLTIEQALANSRRLGINYGIAVNCGLGFPVHSDDSVREYLKSMEGQPCYVALQGEGREWMTLTSPDSVARFDYCFTDAMTFTDDNGKRMRIWINEEIGEIKDKQAFMEMYVKRIVGVMHEPIDIYANATFLPDHLAAEYDALWTSERMQKVIDAAVKNDVAIEINNRYKIPSAAFIKAAKAAGAKFSFGTNNADANLGRLEYPIQMVKQCGLVWQDIFVPKPAGQKPIQVKKRVAA